MLRERLAKTDENYQYLNQWLQEGIAAAKSGHLQQARYRLLDVVERDQTNETAWYWLYQVSDHPDDKQICLDNLLLINPNNQWARQERQYQAQNSQPQPISQVNVVKRPPLEKKEKRESVSRPSVPSITLNIVTALWIGIAIIFLGGGIFATGEWFISGFRSRTFPNYITVLQIFELFVAILFVMGGIITFNVALGLYQRSLIGFYSSLLLGLTFLLIGPTISLIANPPNYLVMICTGGVAGVIVLLTLANQPAFSKTEEDNGKTIN